jgi:CBS domain-containing protein
MFIFFTEIVRKDVIDRHGRYVGRPFDFTARFDEAYPCVLSLVASRGTFKKTYYVIPWKDIHITDACIQLKVPIESLEAKEEYRQASEMTLRTGVLDQQVVDTLNRKVVRVNDLHFLRVNDDIRLAHVDIGVRGLVRRLGFEGFVDFAVRLFNKHADYLTRESLVSWKYVQPLSIQQVTGKIQLNVQMEQLSDIPPPDISTMLMELDPYQRAALIKTLEVQHQVDIITELDLKWQKDLIDELDTQAVVKLFERMPADEATDLLSALPGREADKVLSLLSAKKAREITELMKHEADSAGGLMTKEFITLKESMTVEEAIDRIRHVEISKVETIYVAYVIDDDGKLVGSVSFRRLLLEPLEMKISEVMLEKPPSVNVGESVREVAYEMDKYNLSALPTVDDDGALQGIITIDDVLHIAVEEAWGKRSGL